MALWSKGIDRSRNGTPRLEDDRTSEIYDYLEGQTQIISIDIVDRSKWIVDIQGSIEIRHGDLDNGKLPFKIGRLTGDLILIGEGRFKKSILPLDLGGDIVIDPV